MTTRNASETGSWWRARFVAIARQVEAARPNPRPAGAGRIRPGLTGTALARRFGTAISRT